MIFHWLKVYGKPRRGATAVMPTQLVDAVFARAVAVSPAVFAASSYDDAARKEKFEHMCPWLALEMAPAAPKLRRAFTEAMLDRIEVGLREASVGDMKVGREVRAYASAMNGRMQRYIPLIEQGSWSELAVAMAEHGLSPELAEILQTQALKKAA